MASKSNEGIVVLSVFHSNAAMMEWTESAARKQVMDSGLRTGGMMMYAA